jgi:hypothetical protein
MANDDNWADQAHNADLNNQDDQEDFIKSLFFSEDDERDTSELS